MGAHGPAAPLLRRYKRCSKTQSAIDATQHQTKNDASSYARARARSPSHTQPVWATGPRYNAPSVTPVAARLGAWFPASLCSLKSYKAKRDGCEKWHFAGTLCRFTFRTGLNVVRPSAKIVIFGRPCAYTAVRNVRTGFAPVRKVAFRLDLVQIHVWHRPLRGVAECEKCNFRWTLCINSGATFCTRTGAKSWMSLRLCAEQTADRHHCLADRLTRPTCPRAQSACPRSTKQALRSFCARPNEACARENVAGGAPATSQ